MFQQALAAANQPQAINVARDVKDEVMCRFSGALSSIDAEGGMNLSQRDVRRARRGFLVLEVDQLAHSL